jgi:hypothetical protein
VFCVVRTCRRLGMTGLHQSTVVEAFRSHRQLLAHCILSPAMHGNSVTKDMSQNHKSFQLTKSSGRSHNLASNTAKGARLPPTLLTSGLPRSLCWPPPGCFFCLFHLCFCFPPFVPAVIGTDCGQQKRRMNRWKKHLGRGKQSERRSPEEARSCAVTPAGLPALPAVQAQALAQLQSTRLDSHGASQQHSLRPEVRGLRGGGICSACRRQGAWAA